MAYPKLAPAEQDVGLHTLKAERQGIMERMRVGIVVMGVRRQDWTAGARGNLSPSRARTDCRRDQECHENPEATSASHRGTVRWGAASDHWRSVRV
jgi:hypothetical protein